MNSLALLATIALSCASTDPLLTDGSNEMTGPLNVRHGSSTAPSIVFDNGGTDEYPLWLDTDLFAIPRLNLGEYAHATYFSGFYTSFMPDVAAYDVENEVSYAYAWDIGFADENDVYNGNLFALEYGKDTNDDPQGGAFVGPVQALGGWTAGSAYFSPYTLHLGSHEARSDTSNKPVVCTATYVGQEDPDALNDKTCFFAGGLFGAKSPQTVTIADDTLSDSEPSSTAAPTSSVVLVTCNDPDGCTYTPTDPSAATSAQSFTLDIVNVGSNDLAVTAASGSMRINGGYTSLTLQQNDSMSCVYTGATSTGVWSCRF